MIKENKMDYKITYFIVITNKYVSSFGAEKIGYSLYLDKPTLKRFYPFKETKFLPNVIEKISKIEDSLELRVNFVDISIINWENEEIIKNILKKPKKYGVCIFLEIIKTNLDVLYKEVFRGLVDNIFYIIEAGEKKLMIRFESHLMLAETPPNYSYYTYFDQKKTYPDDASLEFQPDADEHLAQWGKSYK